MSLPSSDRSGRSASGSSGRADQGSIADDIRRSAAPDGGVDLPAERVQRDAVRRETFDERCVQHGPLTAPIAHVVK